MLDGHYDKADNKKYKYKIVWWEDEREGAQPMTALGDEWKIDGSFLIFKGKMGEIVLSPAMRFVIK